MDNNSVPDSTLSVDLGEIFEKDTEQLAPEDIKALIAYHRAERDKQAELDKKVAKPRKARAKKSDVAEVESDNPLDKAVGKVA